MPKVEASVSEAIDGLAALVAANPQKTLAFYLTQEREPTEAVLALERSFRQKILAGMQDGSILRSDALTGLLAKLKQR